MGLLALTGQHRIGRVRIQADEPLAPGDGAATVDLEELLKWDSDEEMMEFLVEALGFRSGVSGIQPKVLGWLSEDGHDGVVQGTTGIIKVSGQFFPYLALNESLCLRAAGRAGLEVPGCTVYGDGKVLVVERFDYDPDSGNYLGFEEMGSVMSVPSIRKYKGSLERVIKYLDRALTVEHRLEDKRRFFDMIVMNTLLRNGDAHLKNFGLLYTDRSDVRLAPAYDLATTTAYMPRDQFALTMNGKQSWPTRKTLEDFGVRWVGLPRSRVGEHLERGIEAIRATVPDVHAAMKENPGFYWVGQAMLAQWDDAIRSLDARKEAEKRRIHTGIEVPDPPAKRPRRKRRKLVMH